MLVFRTFNILFCLFLVLLLPEACKTNQPSISLTPPSTSCITNAVDSSTLPILSAPPTILSTILPVDSAGTWVGLDVSINFSIPMDENTTAEAVIISPKIIHEVSWKNNSTTMIIHPLANWAMLTECRITIADQARSAVGTQIEQEYSATFDVKDRPAPPLVISTEPANRKAEVAPEAIIRILFSKPMNTKATEQSLVIIPNTDLSNGYAILWDKNNQILDFYFASNMKPGERYIITITNKALSSDGIYAEANYTFVFDIMEC